MELIAVMEAGQSALQRIHALASVATKNSRAYQNRSYRRQTVAELSP